MGKNDARNLVIREMKNCTILPSRMVYLNTTNKPVDITQIDTLHYEFDVDRFPGQLQMTVAFFEDGYCDLLMYVHPVIVDRQHVVPVVRFINFINSNFKPHNCSGRFYVDEESLDIAFVARQSYTTLQEHPANCIKNCVSAPICFFQDMADPLYMVSKGSITYEQATLHMEEIWGISK